MIGIRVDANETIATGHAVRCLSIANGLKDKKIPCVFIAADKNTENFLLSSGFQVICLDSIWNNLDSEIDTLKSVINELKIDKLIIDTYFVTEKYLSEINKITSVIYIDDLNLFKYPVDVIINYSLYAEDIPYSEIYKDTNTKLLLGPKYTPLRAQFKSIKPAFRDKVTKILITIGGLDTFDVTGKILEYILNKNLFNDIEFHVVLGRMNIHSERIYNLASRRQSFIIHENVSNMAELMVSCDAAVSAGGTTLYELCACSVPTVCLSTADNQLMNVKAFEDKGLMKYAGDVRDDIEMGINNIMRTLQNYISNSDERCFKSDLMKKTVDECGVDRIIDDIILII